MEEILKKHNVRGDVQALQRAFRKRKGHLYFSSFRDDLGRREVIAMPSQEGGMDYVLVDACNNKSKILKASERMRKSITTHSITRRKLVNRVRFLSRKAGMVPRPRTITLPAPENFLDMFFPIEFLLGRSDLNE